jgi:hypothetical protein
MACCAFALFVLGQIAAMFAAFRRAVPFGLLGRPSLEPDLNPATAWQLGATAPAVAVRPRRRMAVRALVVAAGIELVLLGGGALWALHGAHASEHASAPGGADTIWCWSGTP